MANKEDSEGCECQKSLNEPPHTRRNGGLGLGRRGLSTMQKQSRNHKRLHGARFSMATRPTTALTYIKRDMCFSLHREHAKGTMDFVDQRAHPCPQHTPSKSKSDEGLDNTTVHPHVSYSTALCMVPRSSCQCAEMHFDESPV